MLALALANPAIPPAPTVTPPPSRTILALDLSTRTGWAVQTRSGSIASGVTEFRPGRFEGAGMAFLRFEKFLADLNRDAGPFDAVVFEEVRAHAGTLAAQVYGGFLAHLTAWCECKAAPYLGVPVATIKRHARSRTASRRQYAHCAACLTISRRAISTSGPPSCERRGRSWPWSASP